QADEIERLAGKLKCSDAIARGATKALNTAAAELERLTAHIKLLEGSCQDCPTFLEQEVRIEKLEAALSAVYGWRENDHPEWFCRRTAEYVADLARAALAELAKT
ncbi:MAG: hypothetical protein V3S12_00310, partial [Acidiferrobacterales bacterium]